MENQAMLVGDAPETVREDVGGQPDEITFVPPWTRTVPDGGGLAVVRAAKKAAPDPDPEDEPEEPAGEDDLEDDEELGDDELDDDEFPEVDDDLIDLDDEWDEKDEEDRHDNPHKFYE